MATKRQRRMVGDVCSSNGHESCPVTWSMGDVNGTDYLCSCECHAPRATCRRCSADGLAWAKFPQEGFRRQRLLENRMFQPFSAPIKVKGFPPRSTARHICGVDAEEAAWFEIECYLWDQYDERQEILREMGRAS